MSEELTTNIPVEEALPVIDLSATRKQRFRIDGVGDGTSVLELNTSDLATVTRLSEVYPKLQKLDERIAEIGQKAPDGEPTEEDIQVIGKELKEVDTLMREYIDYIFDSNVSELCAPDGSMYDPFGGKMRWEHIIEVLSGLYDNSLGTELKKIKARSKKYTQKYTNKRR